MKRIWRVGIFYVQNQFSEYAIYVRGTAGKWIETTIECKKQVMEWGVNLLVQKNRGKKGRKPEAKVGSRILTVRQT
jgi:hypothetical protein